VARRKQPQAASLADLTRKIVVPGGGVEPPRAEARRILSPLRLPVPPSRLYLQVPHFTAYFTFYVFVVHDNDCDTVQVNVEVFMDFHSSWSLAHEALLRRSSGDDVPLAKQITRTSVRDFSTQRTLRPISKLWPAWRARPHQYAGITQRASVQPY
jgi:hypothetical protein